MTNLRLTLLLLVLFISTSIASGSDHERHLLNSLLDKYERLERPVRRFNDTLIISLGVTLNNILDVNEDRGDLRTNLWVTMVNPHPRFSITLEWYDANMRWHLQDFGNITDIRIPPHRVYKPDIYVFNSVDLNFDPTYQTNVLVHRNGRMHYVTPGIYSTSCKFNSENYPFDIQQCEIQFGSWTYDASRMDLQLRNDNDSADLSAYAENSDWELLGMPCTRNEKFLDCCREPYVDITCTIHMKRLGGKHYAQAQNLNRFYLALLLLSFVPHPASFHKLSISVFNMVQMMWIPYTVRSAQREYYNRTSGLEYERYNQDSYYGYYTSNAHASIYLFSDQYFGYLVKLVFVALSLNVFVIYIFHNRSPMPKWMRNIVANLQKSPLKYIFPTGDKSKNGRNKCKAEKDNLRDEGKCKVLEDKIVDKNDWKYLACALDRLFFIAFLLTVPVFYVVFFPSKG